MGHRVTTEALPVVDLGPLAGSSGRSDDDAQLQALADAIRVACTDVGFFYVTNHGVPPSCIDGAVASARAFYALPERDKQTIALGPTTAWRGWTALGSEVTAGRRDWHECVDIMTERAPDAQAPANASPLHGRNRWPDAPPGFRSAIEAYFAALTRVGALLMEGLSLSCGLPRSFFATRFTREPWCLLRLLAYPPQPAAAAPDVGIGVGEHTDYGCLTLLHATAPGLAVRRRDGAWIEAPPLPGMFVCNLGDAMEAWTYGRYRATPHRVVATSDRISIPFFFDPSLDAWIEPIEALRPEGAPRVAPFLYGPYLQAAYERSYPTLRGASS